MFRLSNRLNQLIDRKREKIGLKFYRIDQTDNPYSFYSGGTRINYNQISEDELELLRNYRPELVYGKAVVQTPDKFIPATLAFDKKVLRFYGYFKQTVPESPSEYYRVRLVKIFYYLEDDSLEIFEEAQENSGIPQGKLLRRHRFPKNDQGETYNFRDINLGQNLAVYGKVFRICDCDAFTRVSE